jgi:hypothetical protein
LASAPASDAETRTNWQKKYFPVVTDNREKRQSKELPPSARGLAEKEGECMAGSRKWWAMRRFPIARSQGNGIDPARRQSNDLAAHKKLGGPFDTKADTEAWIAEQPNRGDIEPRELPDAS